MKNEVINSAIKLNEIVYCDMIIEVMDEKRRSYHQIQLKDVVYKETDGTHKGDKVIELKIKARLGFAAKTNRYTEAKKNDEIRNNKTGTYE